MVMKRKRTSAFIGSTQWRRRDTRTLVGPGFIKMTDKPSRISVTYYTAVLGERLYQELAHRVIQLTT